jgi:hypothetical protein
MSIRSLSSLGIVAGVAGLAWYLSRSSGGERQRVGLDEPRTAGGGTEIGISDDADAVDPEDVDFAIAAAHEEAHALRRGELVRDEQWDYDGPAG